MRCRLFLPMFTVSVRLFVTRLKSAAACAVCAACHVVWCSLCQMPLVSCFYSSGFVWAGFSSICFLTVHYEGDWSRILQDVLVMHDGGHRFASLVHWWQSGCLGGWLFFLQTISQNWEGLSTVVRGVGAPYRRVRIPGSSDLCVCEVSANKVIALWTRCFHLMIQQAIHWLLHALS